MNKTNKHRLKIEKKESENLNSPKKKSDAERQIAIARWLNFITAISALIAFVGLGFIYWSIVDGKEATIHANRAWLEPENFSFGEFVPGLPISITMDTKNVGKEPALKVVFADFPDSGFMQVPSIDNNLIHVPTWDICPRNSRTDRGNVIFPEQPNSYERIWDYNAEHMQDMLDVLAGKAIFYWRDCAMYKTFGQFHYSPFCFYIIKNSKDKLRVYHCPVGNDAD